MEHYKKELRAAVCMLLVIVLWAVSAFGNFDAQGYTQAVLDQIFQGEVGGMASFDKKTEKRELEKQYEEYISAFSQSLTEGLNASEMMADRFNALCKEIFRTSRYNVTGAERLSREEYKVTVEIQPVDIFVKWNDSLADSVDSIIEKVENGEYKGTEEEILVAMLADITSQSYELLENACREVTYGEKESVILTVEKDEKGKFGLEDEGISRLIAKILRLDEIQD